VTVEERRSDGTYSPIASRPIGSGTTPVPVSFDLGLPPGDHTLRLTVTSPGGSVSTAPTTVTVPQPPQAPPATAPQTGPTVTPTITRAAPKEGRTVAAKVVSGTVAYRAPGTATYKPLTGSTVLPVGVLLDTEKGTVAVTSVFKGKTQTATFHGGKFSVRQTRTGITELALRGALSCAPATASTARGTKKKKRTLWGKDRRGHYRTRGANSVATVRGTEWKTTDTCRGTTIYVKQGSVSVWPRKGGRSKLVKAGHRLFTPR
jgi:hypothetical protein